MGRRSAGWGNRTRALKATALRRVREAVDEGTTEALGLALEALGVVIPGLGLLKGWAKTGVTFAVASAEQRQHIERGVDVGTEHHQTQVDAGKTMASSLSGVAHPAVPALVVIEDLHLMGPELEAFLDHLSYRAADRPVLVIGTAWPEGYSNQRFREGVHRWQGSGAVELIDMPELDTESRLRLIWDTAPKTQRDVALRVANRYVNPLALRLFLSLDRVRRTVRRSGGALSLTDEELSALPADIESLYRARWSELPAHVREGLALAAGGDEVRPRRASTGGLLR